ncbi:MAG: 4-hydroxy-3-methylbut-2-enyl diphosphate reductase [Bacteroidales bacterium]|nr:4-hydroxy-3-methylbut-2-enyl diphosphate reductase [Bacteroidales bacterium]MBO5263126.1 4-hydroxy-3-methylbut-2-enyl diphosphate reductase [Bacteroidaceae bacterium]
MLKIEIDDHSGFCFGVTTAIQKAEEELQKGGTLYCLGDIVHNGIECERLKQLGLITINHETFETLHNAKVLLRAHGEPPETYETARRNNLELIDATCPVVLKLQQRIKQKWQATENEERQIIIHGQAGHAEVLGLVGQTHGEAIVVENPAQIEKVATDRNTYIYSQTTKSLEGYKQIVEAIEQRIEPGKKTESFDTVCRQVANRMTGIGEFAKAHQLIFFVCGRKSSNGKILFNECKRVNPNSYQIESPGEIDLSLTDGVESIGICGATSTPKWLMENCKQEILNYNNHKTNHYEKQD